MDSYPKKLEKYLTALTPEERSERELLFEKTLASAQEHHFQSPRFWAMRQIISGMTPAQIKNKIQHRLHKLK